MVNRSSIRWLPPYVPRKLSRIPWNSSRLTSHCPARTNRFCQFCCKTTDCQAVTFHLDLLEVISGRLLELQSSVNSGTLHHAARRFHKLYFNAKGFPNYSLRGASSLDDDNHASTLLAHAFCAGWRHISASKCQPKIINCHDRKKSESGKLSKRGTPVMTPWCNLSALEENVPWKIPHAIKTGLQMQRLWSARRSLSLRRIPPGNGATD